MTSDLLATVAVIGKRLKDPKELEAFRAVFRLLQNPLEAQIEAVRELRPNASVTLRRMTPDPTIGSWIALIEWYDGKSHEFAEIGDTAQEALKRLREALERAPKVKL